MFKFGSSFGHSSMFSGPIYKVECFVTWLISPVDGFLILSVVLNGLYWSFIKIQYEVLFTLTDAIGTSLDRRELKHSGT